MAVKKEVYRLTFTADEIFSLIAVLVEARNSVGLETTARSALDKIDDWAYKINKGTANAAYVQSGTKKVGITLESLGGGEDVQNHTLRNLSTAAVSISTSPTKASADLNESEEQELARLEAAMLAELSAQGNENVITEERRKVPREASDDSALFSSLS